MVGSSGSLSNFQIYGRARRPVPCCSTSHGPPATAMRLRRSMPILALSLRNQFGAQDRLLSDTANNRGEPQLKKGTSDA
jgi:hypothetical protein